MKTGSLLAPFLFTQCSIHDVDRILSDCYSLPTPTTHKADAMTARISTFIVNGADYFVANLDDGGVRVGLVGGECISFSEGHKYRAEVCAITNESDAEAFFDRVFCEYFS